MRCFKKQIQKFLQDESLSIVHTDYCFGKKINSVDELISLIKLSEEEILFDGFYEKYKGRYPYRFNKK